MGIVEKRKQIKKNNIIKVIRENDNVSRYALQKVTKYSMTTILNGVTTLLEEGLITEEESTSKNVGRTPVYLRINPQGRYFIGVEFNAENLKVAVVNFAVELVEASTYKIPKHATVDKITSMIMEGIREVMTSVENPDTIEGIGIGIPGYVDRQEGVALEYSYFDQWHHVQLKKIMEEAFGMEVYLDNNINALAYHYRFQHREKDDFVIVSMQYGVRLGIVLGGEIFVGNNGNAGEIGHTKVIGGSRLCSCGKRGCLDSEISYLAIEEKVHEYIETGALKSVEESIARENNLFRMSMLGEAIINGDSEANELLENITGHLGRKLATVISVIDIEDIIALNVCDLDNERFAKQVAATIEENSVESISDNVNVTCEIVDTYAAAKGAAIMIMEDKYGYVKDI